MKWGRGGARSNNQLPRRSRCCPFACVTSKRPGERAARVTYDVRTRAQQGGFYPQDFLVSRSDVEAPFVPPSLNHPTGEFVASPPGILAANPPSSLALVFPFFIFLPFFWDCTSPAKVFWG